MSNSISDPWIYNYLLDVAETYGGDLSSVPLKEKPVIRAQLVKWLTHLKDENDDSHVWALLSDKTYEIPVRFSKGAVRLHKRNPAFQGKPLTEYKTALVSVKEFRPFLTRIPAGDGKSMTSQATLALDANYISLKGSYNVEKWGAPKAIETHEVIREWVEGLRVPGGSGNVLKLRKQEREQTMAYPAGDQEIDLPVASQGKLQHNPSLFRTSPLRTQPNPDIAGPEQRRVHPEAVKIAPRADEMGPTYDPATYIPDPSDFIRPKEWTKRWRGIRVVSSKRAPPPEVMVGDVPWFAVEEEEDLFGEQLDIDSNTREHTPIALPDAVFPPKTPSNWSPSVRAGSSRASSPLADSEDTPVVAESDHSSDTEDEAEDPSFEPSHSAVEGQDDEMEDGRSARNDNSITAPSVDTEITSSYLSAPTPAQRPNPANLSSSLPVRTSSPPLPSAVLPSSPPSSPRRVPLPRALHPPLQRRVPVPRLAGFNPRPETSGPGRILVPCSDSSGMASQSQEMPSQSHGLTSQQPSQSPRSGQSLSYVTGPQGQSSTSSKSQAQSQLRNEVQCPTKFDGPEDLKALRSEDALVTHEAKADSDPHVMVPMHSEPDRQPEASGEVDNVPHVEVLSHLSSSPDEMSTDLDADDEDDVDELESEGSADADVRPVTPVEARLDSDDARTDAMVDAYVEEVPRSTKGKARAAHQEYPTPRSGSPSNTDVRISANQSPVISIRINTPTRSQRSDQPNLPTSPDVFIDTNTFNAALKLQRQTSPAQSFFEVQPHPGLPPTESHSSVHTAASRDICQVYPALHDAAAWSVPSFMRKTAAGKRKRHDSPNTTASITHTRIISVPSSPEEPPTKKMKLESRSSVVAMQTAKTDNALDRDSRSTNTAKAGAQAQVSNVVMIEDSPASVPGPDVAVKHIDLRRSLSVLSISSRGSSRGPKAAARDTAARPKPIHSRPSTSSSSSIPTISEEAVTCTLIRSRESANSIQHIDLRGRNRSSQSSSSNRSSRSKPTRDLGLIDVSSRTGHVGPSIGGSMSKADVSDMVEPLPPEPISCQLPSRTRASARSSGSNNEQHAQPDTKILNGYDHRIDMWREEGGPPMASYDDVAYILCRTGRLRHKQKYSS
ncbi:hypothetical protein OBBRIDRAFT_789922 [Obba rivulosa]|uniref:Telomere replication protein EST3 n=1 Tax=Obba rivulosa TaxID=1052685 RepID=A0A8E2DQ90_9APHY|nr:hypothetical protein OBBRIDRAFT_789922 [Obba rivulosa]